DALPTYGAFALAEMDDGTFPITQNLDFDMTRIDDKLLDIEFGTSEGGFGLRAGRRELAYKVRRLGNDPHAPAASTRGGLDHDRVADLFGDRAAKIGRASCR